MNDAATIAIAVSFVLGCSITALTVFYDQAILVRKGTFYAGNGKEKLIALTFDDGPSPQWTPKILDALKKADIKATFFMLGAHVQKYPDIARRVVSEGHAVGNHGYSHRVLVYYTMEELENEIKKTEEVIRDATGVTTSFFRPPKAWLRAKEKDKIRQMGYEIVLWSLNSKDWVTFDDKHIVRYLVKNVRPGDIILFHDSGSVFGTEGGDRRETVKTIPRLAEKLHGMGYQFVTIDKLLEEI